MEDIHVAIAPRTWWSHYYPKMRRLSWLGPEVHPEEKILPEMARAGFEGTPARAGAGRTPQETVEFYGKYGLKPSPASVGRMVEWWRADERELQVKLATSVASYHRELGLTEVYIMPALTPERRRIAGRVRRDDAISMDDFRTLAVLLNEVGNVTLKEGVRLCFHSHVGSHIETRWEVDTLFSLVDRSVVFQGPDIGHLAWGGADIIEFVKDYAPDIKAMHLKDINPKVRAEGVAKAWDYEDFADSGIFAELGEGLVEFPTMFEILRKAGFKGWIELGTDVAARPTPLESAIVSRSYLKSLGI